MNRSYCSCLRGGEEEEGDLPAADRSGEDSSISIVYSIRLYPLLNHSQSPLQGYRWRQLPSMAKVEEKMRERKWKKEGAYPLDTETARTEEVSILLSTVSIRPTTILLSVTSLPLVSRCSR